MDLKSMGLQAREQSRRYIRTLEMVLTTMIKNREFLEQWEKKYLREEAPDFFNNLRLFEGLYEEARALGAFPLKEPLEGLETKIRLAKAINVSGSS